MAKIRGNTQILGLSIGNAEIATNAAIAYSKLNLSLSVVNADIGTAAAIAWSKISPVFAAPGSILPDTAAAEGTGTGAARSDHAHGINAAAAGALGGTAGSEGTGTSFARDDHGHLAFDTTSPGNLAFGGTAAVGTATVASRRDHAHGMPANPAAGNFDVTRELLTGTVNGTNVTFTTALAISPAGSEVVFMNGIMLDSIATATDATNYSISGTTLTMGAAPIAGDNPRACYGT